MSSVSIVCAIICTAFLQVVTSQQDFTRGQVPRRFSVSIFYPTRPGLNALATEAAICRPIVDQIDRNSARFRAELVTNTNSKIRFSTANSRIMSSRMQSRLDTLANLYSGRMTIVRAWSQYPDSQLPSSSLHYEGRTVSVTLSSRDYDAFLKLAIQAAFDWVYYESSSRVRLSVIPSSCERSLDVVFMLDRSGSVGYINHRRALDFINAAVSFFTIGRMYSRVGVVGYSGSSSIQFDLNRHRTLASLQRTIEAVRYTGGYTNTPAALDHARTLLNPSNNRGARPNSAGIPKIAILITDGKSNRGNLQRAINNIRNTDIQVYVIGIGNIDKRELRDIATNPDNDHVFILQSYLDAAGFVDLLSATTCDTPAVIDPGENVTVVIPGGGINYFQTSCNVFSNKVLVELIDVQGSAFLYASGTVTNPGPLTSNTRSNTSMARRKTVSVTLPRNSKVVYIGVQGHSDPAKCTILVWDQLFNPVDAFIDVVEGAHRGETIYEVHRNLTGASVNTYTYAIIEGNGDRIFSIDSTNGRVFIPSSGSPGVDYNRRITHNLTVQAQNTNQDCQIARIRINIRVISNRIIFSNIPPRTVSETAAVGTQIVQVVASGGAGAIRYSIVNGNSEGKFSINTNNGRLSLVRALNYEDTQQYTIGVRADSVGTTVTGRTNLTINVGDVNEQPSFATTCAIRSAGCAYTITENSPLTTLGTIVATDPDLSTTPNGRLKYQLSPISARFSVNASGVLRSTRSLDRETQSSYAFTLTVSDSCVGCSLSASTPIRITVIDVNDNAPVFSLTHDTIQVSEDLPRNTAVAEYRATDADVGTNANIEYSLSPDNIPFTLSVTGTLSLTGPIDFETRQSYSVNITASNPGTALSATTTTTIQILNVNDNTPVITGEPYRVSVAENSPINTLLTTLTASDADLGIHGDIRYTITSGNRDQTFSLNSVSGALTLTKNLDREMISSFSLAVRARDRGTPRTRQDTTTISVTVTDVNDNAPIFRPDTYSVQLREDIPVGRDVIRVLATDADQPNTPNSIITYSITSGNTGNAFRISNSSGQIQTNQNLDFETTSFYTLVVEGRDGGSPVMSSTATVTVTVINVNENPPTLIGDQSVNISESAPVGSTVAVFRAQDQDRMNITLSIQSGNGEGKFAIGSSSGVITIANMLDYETTTSYALTIRASDGQQNTDSMLAVNVLDINEFSPQFSGPSDFSILEEVSAGSRVGTVQATDGDRDAEVTYEFVGRNQANEKFSLNSRTGEITTTSVLDREALTSVFIPPLSRVTLQVAATDNGSPTRQSFRDYTITLVDINDNTPTFSDTTYSNQLRENLPAGQLVFSSSASDTDLGTNAQISYSFVLTNNQGSSNPFQIDQGTGVITTTMPLDCELQSFYLFSITATDAGSPPRSSTVTGNLTLIDENDNAPQFSQDVYFVTVSESLPPTSTIMTFTATDADKGLNGEVEYSVESTVSSLFLEGETDVIFRIDSTSGRLFSFNRFNYERNAQVNVTVFANDRGVPRLSDSALLVITVLNVDEARPVFTNCRTILTVSENANVNSIIGNCSATDFDTIANGNMPQVSYALREVSFFSIDSMTGAISVSRPLDRETMTNPIRITVLATDLVNQTASRIVQVSILDVNDNAPIFQSTPYRYHFTDNEIRSSSQDFFTIPVNDPDAGSNGTFTLTIGDVMRVSDNETQIEILARDDGNPTMNSSATMTVTFESPCQLQSYTVSNSGGERRLSAQFLCSVAVSSDSEALVLTMPGSFNCKIFGNTPAEIQWLHNGSTITNSRLVQRNVTDVELDLDNAQFSSAGSYACKISSGAGSLQSVARRANIQVSPAIILGPQDTSVERGTTASFKCLAVGKPVPTIEWFIGTRLVGRGSTLSLANVNTASAAVYTCGASNSAGKTTASARLVVFDKFDVVQIEVTNINNPSDDRTCQYFDPSQLEATINSVTKERVMVARLSGSDLCELSPCSPSPCQNGGECAQKDVSGGYECSCRRGFEGVNCTVNIDECSQDPCGDNGVCTDTRGSYYCTCNQNYTGRTCQIEKRCTTGLCSGTGELCLDVNSGYECKLPNPTSSVVVSGSSLTADELNDLIQTFIDNTIRAMTNQNSGQSSRRKRQVSESQPLNTSCQPTFVTQDNNLVLLWTSCPTGEMEPSPEQQQMLCMYMFELGVVATCKSPGGTSMEQPTAPPLSPTSVTVDLVFVDENNKPIDAVTSSMTLENKDTQEALANSGINVAKVTVPDPIDPADASNSGSSVGAALGGTIGGLLGLALLALIIVVVIVMIRKKNDSHKDRQQKKKMRAQQLINMEPCNTLDKSSTTKSSTSTEQLIDGGGDYDTLPSKTSPPHIEP